MMCDDVLDEVHDVIRGWFWWWVDIRGQSLIKIVRNVILERG